MYFIGGRIRFRPIESNEHDAELVTRFRNLQIARNGFFSTDVVTPDTHYRFMAAKKPHDLVWVVERAEDGAPLGTASLTVDAERRIAENGRALIDPAYRREGFGREAQITVLSYAFDHLRLDSIWAECLATNRAIIILCLSLGWRIRKRAETVEIEYQREEWEARREQLLEKLTIGSRIRKDRPQVRAEAASQTMHMSGPWISDIDIRVVNDCLQNGWYDYHYVETFQRTFAQYHGREFGLMTPNCTTALHLLLAGLGVGPGDEVIVPECTWIGTSAPISYVGATPVFCDIDETSWCLAPSSVEAAITRNTNAVIAVGLLGNMPDMDALRRITEGRNIFLIEDAAQALGSSLKGVRAGKFGVGSVFSFHRTKTIATGEGGMLLLDNAELFERCAMLRDHGRRPSTPPYVFEEVAFKYMPSNLQAALGYAQFQRIDELVGKKRRFLEKYREILSDVDDIQLNAEPEGGMNGAWMTALVFGRSHRLTKQAVCERLRRRGLPARPFFYPLSSLPAYREYNGVYENRNPQAYDISERAIILPSALIMTDEEMETYCAEIKSIVREGC